MLKSINVLTLALFMLAGMLIPLGNAKSAFQYVHDDCEESVIVSQVFEEEVHLGEGQILEILPSYIADYSFPSHINLEPQLVYSDDHKPPLF